MSGQANKQQQQQVTSSPTTTAPFASSSAPTVSSPGHTGHSTMDSKSTAAAYESLFDSGYSATAMSLNSSTDVHQSSGHGQVGHTRIGSNKKTPSILPGKMQIDPSGDSGLCIDSGLSIECTSPDVMEPKSLFTHPQQQQPVHSIKSQSGQQTKQQTIQLQSSSSSTLPASQSASSNYECFISNSFAQDEEGDTLLHLAIINDNTRLALELINLAPHPDLLDIRNHLYQTPLILSALTGQTTIAHRLILAGSTIDKRDKFGGTPLHVACAKGDIDMVHTLVAPINQLEVSELTRKAKYRSRPLSGSDCWHEKIVSMIHTMDYNGQTCFHLAAKSGNKKLLEFLIKLGGNINIREGKSGWTILHWSIMNQKIDLVQFLLHSCHANPLALSYAGHSCLHLAYAMQNCNTSILSYNPFPSSASPSNQSSASNQEKYRTIIIRLLEEAASPNLLPMLSSESEYSSSSDEDA